MQIISIHFGIKLKYTAPILISLVFINQIALNFIYKYLTLCIIIEMEETKQDTLTYKFHELIIHQNKLSLTLCDFFEITDFNPSQFFDSSFWCALNSLDDDEWFEVTDDVIEIIGYKGTLARMDSIRSNMFSFVKKHFIENIDYMLFHEQKWKCAGSVGRNKLTLKMKRDSFKMLLMKVNTQYSDQIYKYLMTFEKLATNEIVNKKMSLSLLVLSFVCTKQNNMSINCT